MSVIAPITNISRCSLHDGPGIRTVVYFKGCGLKCKWCHSPETLSPKKELLYIPNKCIRCGRCVELCPEQHIISGNDMVFLRSGCTACGKCAEQCPSLALQLCGEDKTVEQLLAEIQKDTHYFAASDGGVTFSGGECLLHAEFLAQLAQKCKEKGIHTAVESALFVPWENVEKVLPFIDLFFADLKLPNSEKHLEFTGQDNKRIIANIQKLSHVHHHIVLRIPVIPGVNDSKEDLDGFANIINAFGCGVRSVELLKYNHLAEAKYSFVGKTYTKFADGSQADGEMKSLCTYLAGKIQVPCYFV